MDPSFRHRRFALSPQRGVFFTSQVVRGILSRTERPRMPSAPSSDCGAKQKRQERTNGSLFLIGSILRRSTLVQVRPNVFTHAVPALSFRRRPCFLLLTCLPPRIPIWRLARPNKQYVGQRPTGPVRRRLRVCTTSTPRLVRSVETRQDCDMSTTSLVRR